MDKQKVLAYLTSPYQHPSPEKRDKLYSQARRATSCLLEQGFLVYASAVYKHSLHSYKIPDIFKAWEEFDRRMLSTCDMLIVLMLDGWGISETIQHEIAYARSNSIAIEYASYIDVDGYARVELIGEVMPKAISKCPHCGTVPMPMEVTDANANGWVVECQNCLMRGAVGNCPNNAISNWNSLFLTEEPEQEPEPKQDHQPVEFTDYRQFLC